MGEEEEEVVEALRKSRELVGELQEVIVDQDGNVIDGYHRLKAYPGWKTKTVEVKGYKKRILKRLHYNLRRQVTKAETKELLVQLATIIEKEGVPSHEVARKVAELVPYSERYVYQLLPKRFKEPAKAKPKVTFRRLYEAKLEARAAERPAEKKEEKHYVCPVCGTLLRIEGNLLVQI